MFGLLDYAENKDRLVLVDAKEMKTLAQCYFSDEKTVLPEADHGVFIPTQL